MNALVLVTVIFLGLDGTNPTISTTLRTPEPLSDMELNRDPTISRCLNTLTALNDLLANAVHRGRDPEKSATIKRLSEKIRRTEDAIEARKAALQAPPWRFWLLPLAKPPTPRRFAL
jgi:hypothetical protein